MKETWQVVLAGAGGQGLVVAGILLGEASFLYAGKNALQTQSYGAASRGGFSRSEVVVSDSEIINAGVDRPDVVMALTSDALEMYLGEEREDLLIITNDGLEFPQGRALSFPLEKTARDLGNPGAMNLVGLGVIVGITGMIAGEAMAQAITARFSGKPSLDGNLKAYEAGLELGREAKGFDRSASALTQ